MSQSRFRWDYQGPQPSEGERGNVRPKTPASANVQMASDEDVKKAMRRITRDHEALIKALAK